MLRRHLVPDYDFIKNMEGKLFDEFINLEDDLPIYVCMYVREVFPDLNTLRLKATINNPNLEKFDTFERAKTHRMELFDRKDFKIQFALDFLDKYPQFKGIIKSVEYYDGDEGHVIKEVFLS